ncbi:MAG: efflux transporter outer membrane subunit [Thiobacillaceae bacterium]
MTMRKALLGIMLLGLSGCFTMPELKQLHTEFPAAWPEGQAQATVDAEWWKAYRDPALNALIEEALAHNTDIRLAAARIDEARASLGLARADQFPSAEIGAQASRTRQTAVGSFPIPKPLNNDFKLNLQAAYEVDLWGRYRAATRAARADLLATEYAREVVRLSLTSDVAKGYFALRALDAQLELARQTRDTRSGALDLQRLRFDNGISSELDLRQAEAELAATDASIAQLAQSVREQELALAQLLGRSPRAIVEQQVARGAGLNELGEPPAIPAGLPSELLARRPDLRQAEQNLLAAQARISEAKAALFPDLSLTGNYGSESRRLADLFSGPATIWGLTAGLVQTVFNAGRTEAGIQAADARQTQALVGYEQAVQQAFREVLDALVAHRQARELGTADQRRASALARTLELADLRYRNGVDNYLQVLDAQRNLYQAQQSAIDARRAQLAASADLIKALGGGWNGAVADDPTGALALQRAPGLAMPMAK